MMGLFLEMLVAGPPPGEWLVAEQESEWHPSWDDEGSWTTILPRKTWIINICILLVSYLDNHLTISSQAV